MMIIKLLMRLLLGYSPVYEGIDKVRMNQWLLTTQQQHGFRDYFKYRDLQILKSLGNPNTQEAYWMAMGRRMELLMIMSLGVEEVRQEEKTKKKK